MENLTDFNVDTIVYIKHFYTEKYNRFIWQEEKVIRCYKKILWIKVKELEPNIQKSGFYYLGDYMIDYHFVKQDFILDFEAKVAYKKPVLEICFTNNNIVNKQFDSDDEMIEYVNDLKRLSSCKFKTL